MEWDHFDYSGAKEMRERFLPLKEVLSFVDLKDGESLLDVGAGDGHYSIAFASSNPNSDITALEIGLNGTKLIKQKISQSKLENVKILEEDACAKRDYSSYDVIFFSTVFHDLDCREDLAGSIVATLSPGTRVIFIEFKKEAEVGPPAHIRISEKELKGLMEQKGFTLSDSKEMELYYMHKYIIKQKK